MSFQELSERERRVLEAVIQTYVATAEPAGSRTLSRRFGLGVSPATIRNTMSDLEEKGFLFHPHTSAGRVPTDKAYRAYVDSLTRLPPIVTRDSRRLVGDRDDPATRRPDTRRDHPGARRGARAAARPRGAPAAGARTAVVGAH